MKLKIAPELEWFRPYLKRVKNIAPVHKLEKIIALKADTKKLQHIDGQLVTETWEEDGYTYRKKRIYMSIYVTYSKTLSLKPLKRTIKPFSKIDLLELFAHELAHLEHDYHTVAHKKLENRLCSMFMTILNASGYVSEEHEMKNNKPSY